PSLRSVPAHLSTAFARRAWSGDQLGALFQQYLDGLATHVVNYFVHGQSRLFDQFDQWQQKLSVGLGEPLQGLVGPGILLQNLVWFLHGGWLLLESRSGNRILTNLGAYRRFNLQLRERRPLPSLPLLSWEEYCSANWVV